LTFTGLGVTEGN